MLRTRILKHWFILPKSSFGRGKVYAPQTKILEDRTKDRACVFEALFKYVSTRFGLRLIEKSFENARPVFCSVFQNLRLGSINFTPPKRRFWKVMLPKRRFWKNAHKIGRAFSKLFSMSRSPNRVLAPLKSTTKRTSNLVIDLPKSSLGEHKSRKRFRWVVLEALSSRARNPRFYFVHASTKPRFLAKMRHQKSGIPCSAFITFSPNIALFSMKKLRK